MSLLYNSVVGYGQFKNYMGAIFSLILGVCFTMSGIYIFFYPQPPPEPEPHLTPNNQPNNTPSTTTMPYPWLGLSGMGVLLLLFSYIMYFLATDNSETTKNILAVQGTYDAFSILSGVNRYGGNFIKGE